MSPRCVLMLIKYKCLFFTKEIGDVRFWPIPLKNS